jgi:hypothetical protein
MKQHKDRAASGVTMPEPIKRDEEHKRIVAEETARHLRRGKLIWPVAPEEERE